MTKFKKNKTYYLSGKKWKLKYLKHELNATVAEGYYTFKVLEHDDQEDIDEYSTAVPEEILESRKEWKESIETTLKKVEEDERRKEKELQNNRDEEYETVII